MGAETGISWTDHTFNPWVGCTALSPACDRCYAEALVKRWGGDFSTRRRTTATNWKMPARWNRIAASTGARHRVFCASLADVFDNQVSAEWREDLWALIRETPSLDWQLLTKRPQNIARMLPSDWDQGYANVWLGTTVENQAQTARIRHLRAVPAVIKFLSFEPVLEPIVPDLAGIHWAICGGESGPGARPMMQSWAASLKYDCRAEETAFFFKQTGSARDDWPGVTGKGDDPAQWPAEFRVQEMPT